jgi:nucleoside-diphosphate-sugar epimerase
MLELAERHPGALFAHTSTTSAVNAPVIHECDTDLGPVFENIYQRTKQLAEQRVLDAGNRGLKYAIFRIGHVSPGYENGSVARNGEINAMLRLIDIMLLTELLPEQDYKIGYGYVDKIALAFRLLVTPVNLEGMVFHIDNPNTLRLSELFKLSGLKGQVMSRDELTIRLRSLIEIGDEPTRRAALEYLGRLTQGDLEKNGPDIVAGDLRMEATLSLLKRLGFTWPHVTEGYMRGVLRRIKGDMTDGQ